IAIGFAREGATVVVNYIQNETAAEQVVEECIDAGGDAWAVRADVTSKTDVHAMVEEILLETGKIDVVVNNAFKPYTFNPDQRLFAWDLQWSDYQAQLDGSVKSTYHVCHAILPQMRKQGSGSIINMTSDLVERPIIP